jgi:hypothetical protein
MRRMPSWLRLASFATHPSRRDAQDERKSILERGSSAPGAREFALRQALLRASHYDNCQSALRQRRKVPRLTLCQRLPAKTTDVARPLRLRGFERPIAEEVRRRAQRHVGAELAHCAQ